MSCFSKSNTKWCTPLLENSRLLADLVSLTRCLPAAAFGDLGPSCVSSGVKWFHGYKYDTAHKQVLGYKGLVYICTTPSFSSAAWITYCTADTSILCVAFVNRVQFSPQLRTIHQISVALLAKERY